MGWPTEVPTAWGSVHGAADEHGTVSWKGVPFARPPLRDLRWRAPQDPRPWDGVLDATSFAPAPWQPGTDGSSEDCLYLNVWRPDDDRRDLPVYVWLPGGGNRVQMPSNAATPGGLLASRSDVVVVTVSYRVNDIGWFRHPALRTGNALDDSGNYGTLDIIAALRWIQRNIEAFGGDPANVLCSGESAGAYNTLTMLLSPAAKGLFHKALAQSGRQDSTPVEAADERGERVAAVLLEAEAPMSGRELAEFLRSRTPEQIARAARGIPFLAGYRDGEVLHSAGFDALDDGSYPNKVPAIVGMNQEESKFQLVRSRELQEDRELYEAVALAGSLNKRATGCDHVLRRLRGNADQPDVYGYLFKWGWDGGDHPSPLPGSLAWRLGAAHGMDIAFFLHGGDRAVMGQGFTDENRPGRVALGEAMMGYVREFAHTGVPRRPSQTVAEWEPWSNEDGGPKLIEFDADLERAIVRMGRDELTLDAVAQRLSELPDRVRQEARQRIPALG